MMFEGSQLLSLPRGGVGLLRNIQGTAQRACCPAAGLLLACSWPAAVLLVACYWPAAVLLLACYCFCSERRCLGPWACSSSQQQHSSNRRGAAASSGHRARKGSSSGHREAALPFARQPSAPFLAASRSQSPQQRPSTAFARDRFLYWRSYS